ncbi:hypothetical protein J7337_013857 [Fusarium musae]|uniref:Uncharacterized protein n=1 Tax=Fusarium musae TaxID=1042133 RepID=A0A9P8D3L8_9HYPO|nr:hypothetical protein J7337_013857 [Fusarium musae]KAG9494718.1 hypothetical protein J7337_013857 [Fusarium musae]
MKVDLGELKGNFMRLKEQLEHLSAYITPWEFQDEDPVASTTIKAYDDRAFCCLLPSRGTSY